MEMGFSHDHTNSLTMCVQLTSVCHFTWKGFHWVPPGSVLLWPVPRTVRPALTPGTTGHTASLRVGVFASETGKRLDHHHTHFGLTPNRLDFKFNQSSKQQLTHPRKTWCHADGCFYGKPFCWLLIPCALWGSFLLFLTDTWHYIK